MAILALLLLGGLIVNDVGLLMTIPGISDISLPSLTGILVSVHIANSHHARLTFLG